MEGVHSFQQCGRGVEFALLVTVPSLYVLAAVLFVVLGVVIRCWEERQRRRAARYSGTSL